MDEDRIRRRAYGTRERTGRRTGLRTGLYHEHRHHARRQRTGGA